jgi:hypothetical protein
MNVPEMTVVNAGYAATLLGALLLLAVGMWWSWASEDGVQVPRESWPGAVRGAAVAGWALFGGGILLQLVGYLTLVGVARWAGGLGGH